MIIYNWPPSIPYLMAFYDMQGEGCLVLPRSSIVFYTRMIIGIIGSVPLFPVYETTPFLYHGLIIGIFPDHNTMV